MDLARKAHVSLEQHATDMAAERSATQKLETENVAGTAEQVAEGRAGRIGDCIETQDQSHHCHIGEQDQQFGRTAGGRQPEGTGH
jgi:hypothetical protein